MINMTIEKSKGYAGKRAAKSYIARITGLTNNNCFEFSFLEPTNIDWMGSELFRKSKGVWEESYAMDAEGVYLKCEYGDKTYFIIWTKAGELAYTTISEDRAAAIAHRMDAGEQFNDARFATK